MLTKIQFGQELEKRVLQKMPNAEIAQWVQSVYEDGIVDADFAFLELLLSLSSLDGAPDDEFEDEDLLEIAEILQAGEDVEL